MNRREFLAGSAAAPAAMLAAAGTDEDFTSLFDGKTLNGWTIQEGPESAFYVDNSDIVIHKEAGFPTWLRSARQYENFDFRCEFFIQGWMNSGIYLHAPEHGRNTWTGMKINIFQQVDEKPQPESMGSIFPLIAPLRVNVRNKGEWNTMRILMDWPRLRVWTNDEQIQDVDLESVPELRHRLRSGYLGIESLSYANRFRNLRIRELPSKETWQTLYTAPKHFSNWYISEGKPLFQPVNGVIYGDGAGHLATKEEFRDFELHLYVRHTWHHNSGILFRTDGKGLSARHYEIQLHDVEGAHYATGSLYYFKRAIYPRIEAGKWFLLQLRVKDKACLVRINGETVLEYDQLDNLEPGHIELQAHQAGRWTEFKDIRIKKV